jgi:hypothetical protein
MHRVQVQLYQKWRASVSQRGSSNVRARGRMTARPMRIGTRARRVRTRPWPAGGGAWLSFEFRAHGWFSSPPDRDKIVLPPRRDRLAPRTISPCSQDDIALLPGRHRLAPRTTSPCPQDDIALPSGRCRLASRTSSPCPQDEFVLHEDELALPSGRARLALRTSSPCRQDDIVLPPGRFRLGAGTSSSSAKASSSRPIACSRTARDDLDLSPHDAVHVS